MNLVGQDPLDLKAILGEIELAGGETSGAVFA